MEYGKNKKRYVFYITDDQHARFEIRLLEDKIKKTKFFKEFVEAYINDDSLIRKWIDEKVNIGMSKRWKAIRRREMKKEALQKIEFNLGNEDVKEIFDILAEQDDTND